MTTPTMSGAEAEALLRQAHTQRGAGGCKADNYGWPCPIILALDAATERAERAERQAAAFAEYGDAMTKALREALRESEAQLAEALAVLEEVVPRWERKPGGLICGGCGARHQAEAGLNTTVHDSDCPDTAAVAILRANPDNAALLARHRAEAAVVAAAVAVDDATREVVASFGTGPERHQAASIKLTEATRVYRSALAALRVIMREEEERRTLMEGGRSDA